MQPAHAVLGVLAIAATIVFVTWPRSDEATAVDTGALTMADRATGSTGAAPAIVAETAPPDGSNDSSIHPAPDAVDRHAGSDPGTRTGADFAEAGSVARRWPAAPPRAASNAATTEPIIPTRLAFRALWYLGVDPEAEKTWMRAINDPTLPAGVRSDLIVDMIDEGYSDNSRPGAADLPVILARLEIVERHAPYAMDEVNARAFEEAYRTLLELYVRLGGEPRDGR